MTHFPVATTNTTFPLFFFSFYRVSVPLCLGGMITYFAELRQPPQEDGLNASGPASKQLAYYYATGIVVFTVIPVFVFHPFILYIFQAGLKIRVGCCSLIYKKVIKTLSYPMFSVPYYICLFFLPTPRCCNSPSPLCLTVSTGK